MQVVPGSHKEGPLEHVAGDHTRPCLPPEKYHPDKTPSLPVPARAGDLEQLCERALLRESQDDDRPPLGHQLAVIVRPRSCSAPWPADSLRVASIPSSNDAGAGCAKPSRQPSV